MFHYTDLNFIRNILVRANADAEAWEKFESGIRRWGIGSCSSEFAVRTVRPTHPYALHIYRNSVTFD
jgi:hypothetical protein